jgi:hypothetical protein
MQDIDAADVGEYFHEVSGRCPTIADKASVSSGGAAIG